MGQPALVKSEKTVPLEEQHIGLSYLKKLLRTGKQSNASSVIVYRWLALFFCLAFWYGVYRLVILFIS